MLEQLSLILVATVVLAVPAMALVLTVDRHPAVRRLRIPARIVAYRLVVIAINVGVIATGVGLLLGGGLADSALAGAVLAASVLAWLPVGRRWAGRGVVAWALTVDAGVAYLTYLLTWTLTAELSWLGLIASLFLWLFEAFVVAIGLGYAWKYTDVLTRRVWPRSVNPRQVADRRHRPFVSLHVPVHNQPPGLVIATLQRLLEQRYHPYEIVLVDHNTTDPALWRPVEAFCARHQRITFHQVEDQPGSKGNALNAALNATHPHAEVIGVLDTDDLVRPDFLADCAPMFGDPDVAYVQIPRNNPGGEQAPYFRRLLHSYGYILDGSQRSRDGVAFGSRMSLIRRSALDIMDGGWDERCVTEDVELSLRLLRAGGSAVRVERSYVDRLLPLTFEALKRQRFRWSVGRVQVLRTHWRSLLPGRRTDANRLTLGQRWAYLVGSLQWFSGLASALFTALLLVGALDAITDEGLLVEQLSGLLLLSVIVLLVLGAMRVLAIARRASGASWRDAIGAVGLWLALEPTVAHGAWRGLVARRNGVWRTPRARGEPRIRHALMGNLAEVLLALVCTTAGGFVLAEWTWSTTAIGALLLVQAVGFAAAPFNSLTAIRSDLPEDLRQRRRLAPSWATPAPPRGRVLSATAAAVVGTIVFLAPLTGPDLGELGRGTNVGELGRDTDVGQSTTDTTSESPGSEPDRERPGQTAGGTPPPTQDSPTETKTATPNPETTRPSKDNPSSEGPSTTSTTTNKPTSDPTGRPTDKPPPPSNDPPGKPDKPPHKPKHRR